MKSSVSNDNSSSHGPGQGSVRITFEPTCHSLIVHAEASWEAIEHLSNMFVGLGDFQQVFQFKRAEDAEREERRAVNDNAFEARKQEHFERGKALATQLEELRNTGLDRYAALSEIAQAYGIGIKAVENFITHYNRIHKAEVKAERKAQTELLMKAGKSASQIGKELGVSKSEAHRIMQSLKGTDDD